MIEKSLIQFLTDVTEGDTSNVVRQGARSRLRSSVGDHIYAGYALQGNSNLQVLVRRYSHRREFDLAGESPLVFSHVQCTVHARGEGMYGRAAEVGQDLRLALVDYCGQMVAHLVRTITVLSDGITGIIPPDDKSGGWVHFYIVDFEVAHGQPVPNP